MVKPSEIRTMHRQVFDQLRANIINNVWKQGEKIPSPVEIARDSGVSVFAVRKGLRRLAALGLLENRPGKGQFVGKFPEDIFTGSIVPFLAREQSTILQILEYRWIVEKGTASIAAKKAGEEDIRQLEAALRKMEESQNDRELFAVHDLEFHVALAGATHNPVIIKTSSNLKSILEASTMRLVHCLGVNDAMFYHERILQAVKAHDRENAEKWMEEHIARTIRRYIEKNNENGCEE